MHNRNKNQRFSTGVIAGAILAGAALASSTAAYADFKTTVYQASGYGAEVKVGNSISAGPVANALLPNCTPLVGSYTASAASINLPGLVSTGTVSSVASSTLDTSMGSSTVENISLLGGVITADAITAVSSSSEIGGVYSFSSEGSTFTNLKILGGLISVPLNPAPNTVIKIPLVGSVTLNEQETFLSSTKASLTVNMIHVRITLGTNAGTQIIISQGFSDINSRAAPAAMGGSAYAPRLTTGVLTTGALVYELVPCFGTGGVVNTDSIAETNIPGVVSTGAIAVTDEGNVTLSETQVQTTSSIANANVLSGLVSVGAITAVANGVTTTPTGFTFSGGSTLVGLSVSGFASITDNPPPNTKLNIVGLGTLYLNRVQPSADHIRVTAVELIINAENNYGLPIGADLTLGSVEAQLHNATIP
jgi:hypothetical protein